MRLLIAEDDSVTRKLLVEMFRRWNYEIVIACDGNEAWEALERPDAPSLAVLDWMMPGIDGVEVCARARELEKEIRPYVILLTGMTNKKDLVKGFDAGADDYVTKPFHPDELHARIRAGERIVALQIESLAARNALRKLATYDHLTGLRNRAAILAELDRELVRAQRDHSPVAAVMADVDHFKQVNDTYGHPVGDVVLAEIAQRMASEVRSYETIGRYGGEEFLIVLTGCDLAAAGKQAERVRRCVAAKEVVVRGVKLPITVSLGVASTCQGENLTAETLIEMADVAMYGAKLAGRNRVEAAASDEAEPFFPPHCGAREPLAAQPEG
jgi:diguanylate cyclase (GGDEF)-like protein